MAKKKKNYYDGCGAYPLCKVDTCDCLTASTFKYYLEHFDELKKTLKKHKNNELKNKKKNVIKKNRKKR